MTAVIKNDLLRSVGLEFNQVAKSYLDRLPDCVHVVPLRDIVGAVFGGTGDDKALWGPELFVVSADPFVPCGKAGEFAPMFGASVLMSDAAMSKALDVMGYKRIYVLPSSIHEVICVNAENLERSPRDLLEMVTSVNADPTVISPEEKLGDSLYTFSKEEGLRSCT